MIRNAKKEEIESIVNLHLVSLKDGVLYELGKGVLRLFYEEILYDKGNFILVYESDNSIIGVAASTKNIEELLDRIKKKHFARIALDILKKLITNPKLPLKLLQKYPSDVKAELLFLFVDASQRGKGIGEKLVNATSKKFMAEGVNNYKITVLSSNPRGKRFYERIGFKKAQTYTSFGEKRDIYTCKIEK